MLPVEPVLAHLDLDFDQAVERLRDLLRIRSVSTDPAYKGETRQAAQWLADQLTGMGFEASLRDTPGHPMVVAHHPGPSGSTGPHVLYYGHYDVQPPEPLELWNSPPFEPTIVDARHGKRIVARGAVDDKGQVMTFIEAFRAWHAVHGTLPGRITVLLEGEEETGSPNLVPFLEANREELAADICVVTDTNSWNIETPAITYMLRGMLYLEVTLHGPSHDLHSGMYGGAVLNPINALTRILAQIHDDQGRVQFPVSMTTSSHSPTPSVSSGAASASTKSASSAASASRPRAARKAGPRWSGFGRVRPATSTASGAATPGPVPRR